MAKVSAQPQPNLYLYLPWLRKQPKEKEFVLNCDSTDWKLPDYNGLHDRHLTYFFANSKLRANLLKTGVVDKAGNIAVEKGKNSQLSFSKRLSMTKKLPPISTGEDVSVQRIIAPYRAKIATEKPAKLTKYYSTPEKKVSNPVDMTTPPKTTPSKIVKKLSFRAKPNNGVRKIQPLSKDQLEQVFAKYQIKLVQSNTNCSTDGSDVAEEKCIDNDKKLETTPNKSHILISEARIDTENDVLELSPEEKNRVEVTPKKVGTVDKDEVYSFEEEGN